MPKETKILRYADLLSLNDSDLIAKTKASYIKHAAELETAKEEFSGSLPQNAKIMAVHKSRYTDRLAKREIPAGTTWAAYHEAQTGEPPEKNTSSMANLWNTLVESGKLTEAIWDDQPADALLKACGALAAINRKVKGTNVNAEDTDEFRAVVNALNKPGDAAKKIKAITKDLNKKPDTSEPAVEVTLEQYVLLMAGKHTLEKLIEMIGKVTSKLPDSEAKPAFLALQNAQDHVAKVFGDKVDAWINPDKKPKATKPRRPAPGPIIDADLVDPKQIPAQTPAEPVAA